MADDFAPDQDALDRQKKYQELLLRYKNTFSTSEGRRVLGDILVTCHFGVPLNTEAERIEYNIGITIARMSGVMEDIDAFLGIKEA